MKPKASLAVSVFAWNGGERAAYLIRCPVLFGAEALWFCNAHNRAGYRCYGRGFDAAL